MTYSKRLYRFIQNILQYLFKPEFEPETWETVDTLQTTQEATVCIVQSFTTGNLSVRKRYGPHSLHVQNEIHSLRTISHTNIIKIENVIYNPDSIDIMLKKYDTDLFSYIIRISDDPEVFFSGSAMKLRVDWMKGISEGLCYLHSKGIVHCDIKPENILIDRSATLQDASTGAVLTDFGYATSYTLPNKTISGMMGSLQYAAPELFVNKINKGLPLDIFSLGATIWVSVYGLFPWNTDKNGVRSNMYDDTNYNPSSEFHLYTKRAITNFIKLLTLSDPDRRPDTRSVNKLLDKISKRYVALEYTLQVVLEN